MTTRIVSPTPLSVLAPDVTLIAFPCHAVARSDGKALCSEAFDSAKNANYSSI
jgi:hypothetical protein